MPCQRRGRSGPAGLGAARQPGTGDADPYPGASPGSGSRSHGQSRRRGAGHRGGERGRAGLPGQGPGGWDAVGPHHPPRRRAPVCRRDRQAGGGDPLGQQGRFPGPDRQRQRPHPKHQPGWPHPICQPRLARSPRVHAGRSQKAFHLRHHPPRRPGTLYAGIQASPFRREGEESRGQVHGQGWPDHQRGRKHQLQVRGWKAGMDSGHLPRRQRAPAGRGGIAARDRGDGAQPADDSGPRPRRPGGAACPHARRGIPHPGRRAAQAGLPHGHLRLDR